jgi:hypothetical protein
VIGVRTFVDFRRIGKSYSFSNTTEDRISFNDSLAEFAVVSPSELEREPF